jgi:hypothetical protein
MLLWLLAATAGIAVAAFAYGWREPRRLRERVVPALLRAAALTAIIAALLDAPAGRARPPAPLVALDASMSWVRGADSAAWRAAVERAREAGDSLILFGDSARRGSPPDAPGDRASRIRPAVTRALAAGRPLLAITDGAIDDPDALASLPSGSRIEVIERASARDAAVATLDLPRTHMRGDTLEARIGLLAGATGAGAGRLELLVGESRLGDVSLDALPPYAERTVVVRAPVVAGTGPTIVRAAVTARDDSEARNDTLSAVVDLTEAAGAVFISSSPDFDARAAVGVLRGSISVPTRAYYRVAPGEWRSDGALTPVAEAEVRRAVREAPLVVVHGDTMIFGPPHAATDGALALVPAIRDGGEWYAVGAPASPLAAALSGLHWDSLPPIAVSRGLPAWEWQGLETRRARQFERRPAIVGAERPRRQVLIGAAGLWRWRFRGGTSADAYAALWGSIFDWLLEDRGRPRTIGVAEPVVRAGEPIRWRRGTGTDSVPVLTVTRRNAPSRTDTVVLRFGGGSTLAESPPLERGIYDVTHAGGRAILAVSAPRELLPRAVTVTTGTVGEASPAGEAPRLRIQPWIYVLALALLCVEWIIRRRRGWR